MSKSTSKTTRSLGSRLLGGADARATGNGARVTNPVLRFMGQLRDIVFSPLRPIPFAHVSASGNACGLAYPSAPDTAFLRERIQEPPPVSAPALQHAHRLMSLLPAWLPMPETRRNNQGQVVLSWQGEHSRHFSVIVAADGMLIYSARLGGRGRFDGAEPIGHQLSPIIVHAIEQLRDPVVLPR